MIQTTYSALTELHANRSLEAVDPLVPTNGDRSCLKKWHSKDVLALLSEPHFNT